MNIPAPTVSDVSVVSAPQTLLLIETIWLLDGEPSHDLIWGAEAKPQAVSHGLRRVACTTLNRNTADPSPVTPGASAAGPFLTTEALGGTHDVWRLRQRGLMGMLAMVGSSLPVSAIARASGRCGAARLAHPGRGVGR